MPVRQQLQTTGRITIDRDPLLLQHIHRRQRDKFGMRCQKPGNDRRVFCRQHAAGGIHQAPPRSKQGCRRRENCCLFGRQFGDAFWCLPPLQVGIAPQCPQPGTRGINENAIIDMIDPAKDADGMHPYNLGELVLHVRGDISTPLPCTPRGVLELLDAYDIDLNGKEVCVLGRGITIGRTIGLMLTRNAVNATVTLCHTGTRDVADHMRRADVIVAAMGSAGFVTPDKIKDGAVLVDVGVSRVYDEEAGRYRIKGDVDKACYDKASAYTPNPGGVGPMTRAMLLANVVEMAERHA